MKTQLFKIFRMRKGGPQREGDSNTSLCQEKRKVLNIQPNITSKGAGKRTPNKG